MRISIEVPAFKGQWLGQCIESVFAQTSPEWELSVIWDGGDSVARAIVERLAALDHPRVRAYAGDRRGIARARRFLTERSTADWILPLDDDDLLAPDAVRTFLDVARAHPWAGIVRARRAFIDEAGAIVQMDEWFPFEPRRYWHGMVTDLSNHCQPYLISRAAYDRTEGWTGFEDYSNAGEDCDIFTRIEEVAPIVLHDELIYYYRLHGQRASHVLGPAGAKEMWRRIADGTIARLGLPLRRISEELPFQYELLAMPPATPQAIEFVIAGEGDAERTRCALRSQGVSDYAIRPVPGPVAWARNRGFALSTQSLVCFLDAGAVLAPGAVGEFASRLDNPRTDLIAHVGADDFVTSLMLVRGEVFRAVGGFDRSYSTAGLASADFLFKARRRDFVCATGNQWIKEPAGEPDATAAEIGSFLFKWGGPGDDAARRAARVREAVT